MDDARTSLAEVKRNMATHTESVQTLETKLNQSELRREELEAELNNTQEVKNHLNMSSNKVGRGLIWGLSLPSVRLCVSAPLPWWRLSAAPSQLTQSGPLSRRGCVGCSERLPCWRLRRRMLRDRL